MMFPLASLPALLPQWSPSLSVAGAAVGAQAVKPGRVGLCNAICLSGKGETGLAASSFRAHPVTTLLPDKGGQIPQPSPPEPGDPYLSPLLVTQGFLCTASIAQRQCLDCLHLV